MSELGIETASAPSVAELPSGALAGLVWVSGNADLGTPRPLASLGPEEWRSLCERPLHEFVAFMQAAHARLRDAGGTVVVVVPTIAMTGAAGLAPWAAVADGQRALVKSAARVWGGDGITVNCLAAPARLLAGHADDVSRPDLQNSALAEPDLAQIAGVISALVSPGLRMVSGATIGVDGGRWMNP